MMDNLEYEGICDILDEYYVGYEMIEPKGVVDYCNKRLLINPIYNEDVDTLMHEFTHIYTEQVCDYGRLPEPEIEELAQRYLAGNIGIRDCLESYLCERVYEREYKED